MSFYRRVWPAASGRPFSSQRPVRAVTAFAIAISLFSLGAKLPVSASYTLEKASAPPPAELPAALRGLLSADLLRVSGPNGVLCEVWLGKQIPVVATPSTELGVTFGQIAEGTLLGVMRIGADTTDFREQKVKPGLYTLRYALHPVDGNHTGIAPQRDFALLSPVTEDADPATITRDEALKRSAKTTGTRHPSVWSLWPGDDSATNPSLRYQGESQTWLLTFRLGLAGGKQLPIGMVVVGHAPEA